MLPIFIWICIIIVSCFVCAGIILTFVLFRLVLSVGYRIGLNASLVILSGFSRNDDLRIGARFNDTLGCVRSDKEISARFKLPERDTLILIYHP